MRTNIDIDNVLMEEAMVYSKLKTKKDIVEEALKHYVASLKRKKILSLRAEGAWVGDLDQMRGL